MAYPVSIYGKFGMEKDTTTSQKHKLGTRMEFPDGRVFYYALANGAIGAGKLVMQKNHTNSLHVKDLAVKAAATVGATAITFGNTGAAITKNQFQDGLVFVNDVDGEGHVYVIKSNASAATAATNASVKLEEDDGIAEALTTNSEIGLRTNKFKDVELWDSDDIDGICLGVAPTEIADNEYFWCQTWGSAAVLTNGTVVLGNVVYPTTTGTVDGNVTAVVAIGTHPSGTAAGTHQSRITVPAVGIVESVGATTEYSLVFVTLSR